MTNIATQLTIRLLGAPEAHIAGAPLALHNQKARAILSPEDFRYFQKITQELLLLGTGLSLCGQLCFSQVLSTRRLTMSDTWEGKAMPIYQIRLKEQLDQHRSACFGGLMVTTKANGETLLTGEVVDQAANYEVAPALAAAVAQAAMDTGEARLYVDAQLVERYCRDFIYAGIMAPVPPLNKTPRKELQA